MAELRAINNAKIKTLLKVDPDSPDLMRCQIVGKILEDDHCFAAMTEQEIVEVLTTIGFTAEQARAYAARR